MSRIYRLSLFAAVGVSSFWVGRYIEKPKFQDRSHEGAFAIFDKVLAKSLTIVDEPVSSQLPSVGDNKDAVSLDNKTARIGQVGTYLPR